MSPDRVALTLGTLAVAAAVCALMLRGWRSRGRRQADLPAPAAAPAERGRVLVGAVPGLFVGTVLADDWLDRVVVHRLSDRAAADLVVTEGGVSVVREHLPELYLPLPDVVAAEVGDSLAGKVMGPGGLLLLTWRLGERQITSAFRADDHTQHRRLADAVTAVLSLEEASW